MWGWLQHKECGCKKNGLLCGPRSGCVNSTNCAHNNSLRGQDLNGSSSVQFLNISNALYTPEVARHRKRQIANMSSTMLSTLAFLLFQNLRGSFWTHISFQRLQEQTQTLAQRLARYTDYLSSQNKIIKSCTCPINFSKAAFWLHDSQIYPVLFWCAYQQIRKCVWLFMRDVGWWTSSIEWVASRSAQTKIWIHPILGEKLGICINHAQCGESILCLEAIT